MFLTMEECSAICMQETEDPPQTRSKSAITFPEDDYDEDDDSSEESDEDSSEESDEDDKDKENICHLPPISPGPAGCMGFSQKWTFSKSEGQCVSYIYGGCHGTKNLFDTKEKCEKKCSSQSSKSATADVCGLPLVTGMCQAFIPSFGFNKDTGRCEAFIYGGCKGNGNRFQTVEECVNTCGGTSAPVEDNTKCQDVTCDSSENKLKTSQGCVPVTQPGECCPSSWDCGVWESRMARTDQCFYQGQFYQAGEAVEGVDEANPCHGGCMCELNSDGLAEIICAVMDCAPPPPAEDNCVPTYARANQCCPADFSCGDTVDTLATCTLDGKTYHAGEKMYPKNDSCVTCLCDETWDGDIHGEHCFSADCDLNLSGDLLLRGCVPVYQEDVCCHTDWVCPQKAEDLKVTETETAETKTAIKTTDKCLLPKAPGPCKMASQRFYFDMRTRSCKLFIYGGCKGNENNFQSEEECENTCSQFKAAAPIWETEAKKAQCDQDKSAGKCRGFNKKYYFNANSRQCNEFIYTGCGGNDNRFDSLDECEITCPVIKDLASKPGKDTDRCDGPVIIGNCRSRMEKYYYDKSSGLCNKFYYSGCGGGDNMFDTLSQCTQACVQPQHAARAAVIQDLFVSDPCQQKQEVGPCRAAKPRWFFNQEAGVCEQFLFGGCRGNDNNFASQEKCEERCVDQMLPPPIDVSTLPARLPAPAFPGSVAVPPLSGGCLGCPSPSSITPDVKMVAGHGSKKMSEFYPVKDPACDHGVVLKKINSVSKQVVAGMNYIFSWTLETRTGPDCSQRITKTCSDVYVHKPLGCKTENYADCLQLIRTEKISCDGERNTDTVVIEITKIEDEEVDPCFLEKQPGRCFGAFNRFYFDPSTKSCQPFMYGGCMGNSNNFADRRSCESQCGQHMAKTPRNLRPTPINPICQLPMEAGPCFALKPRYFFNFETRRCEQFIYGGCRGNENNFATMTECVSSCGKHPRGLPPPVEPVAEESERCVFGNETFAVGDIVRLPGDHCRSCVCSSPPELTCFVTKCPLKMFLPPPGGVNCVMEKDELGCCDTGYKCEEVSPPSVGGSFPVLGGYGGPEEIQHEQKMIAAVATDKIVSTWYECPDTVRLLEVNNFQRQVVAGTNFRLSLKLKYKAGPSCEEERVELCENIILFRPLPHACSPSDDNAQCLTYNQDDRQCSLVI